MVDLMIKLAKNKSKLFKVQDLKYKYFELSWLVKGKPPDEIMKNRVFFISEESSHIEGYSRIVKTENDQKNLKTSIAVRGWFKYYGPQLDRQLVIQPNGFRIYSEEFGKTYDEIKYTPEYSLDILKGVLKGISDHTYPNAYFFHSKMSRVRREKYSYDAILILYDRLHWNCRIIELIPKKENIYNVWKKHVEKGYMEYYKIRSECHHLLLENNEFLTGL